MHDVAWRGMWICVRSKDAQKQLARTSLSVRVLLMVFLLRIKETDFANQAFLIITSYTFFFTFL